MYRTQFVPTRLPDIISRDPNRPTVVLATLNYEERSVGFLQRFIEQAKESALEPSRLCIQLLWPQGQSRVHFLEELKALYLEKLAGQVGSYVFDKSVFAYPNDYNEREVVDVVQKTTESFPGEPLNLVVDLSCMPRKVLVSVCLAISQALEQDERDLLTVYFAYSSPARYATLRYAQNIGGVYGYLSARSIHDWPLDRISAIIFPSLQGYEGKVLYDEVRRRVTSTVTAFIAVGGRDYHISLATMRANQFLMEQKDVDVVYYFSLLDGMDKLAKRIEFESAMESKLVLVAPFGPKVFTLAAFFMLSDLKARRPECGIEIAHVSGFQYLSVYSLGFGETTVFELVRRRDSP